MEDSVKQRIKDFCKTKHLTISAFENLCNLTNGYVAAIRRSVGNEKLASILKAFPELNREWLLYGEGEMLKPHQPQVVQNNFIGDNNYVGNGNICHGKECNHNCTLCSRKEHLLCATCGGEVITPEVLPSAPIVPTVVARMPEINVLEYMRGLHTGIELSNIAIGGLRIDMWHRLSDSALAPDYRPGDLLALCAYPQGQEKPRPGKLHAIDTCSNGLIICYLFPEESGYRAHFANHDKYPDFWIEREEMLCIYKVMLMVRM